MYRHNGGVRGKKAANNFVSAIKSVELPRGRMNGGILGGGGNGDRLSDNLEENINNTSGIWDVNGLVLIDEDVTTVTTIDTSYWRDDPPYQRFVETSRYVIATGPWYAQCSSPPCGDKWGCGGRQTQAGNAGFKWTYHGSGAANACSDPWIYEAYQKVGYYTTVDPPPVYVTQSEEQSTTTTHRTWNFFA